MLVSTLNSLLAQTAEGAATGVVYELSRLRDFDNPALPMAVFFATTVAVLAVVWYLYRRDAVELPRPVGVLLAVLRIVAFGGLIVYFLGVERRTTRDVVRPSQVAVLIDSSQSMGLPAEDAQAGETAHSRLSEVIRVVSQSPLVEGLRRSHDVGIFRFDRDLEPLAALALKTEADSGRAANPTSPNATERGESRADGALEAITSLQPQGTETRLGQALEQVLRHYREMPLAGVIIFSDGGQNSGVDSGPAVELAKQGQVPFYTAGVGSTQPQRNVAVRDLVMPTRAFPGDAFEITAFLQSNGFANREIEVELYRRRPIDPAGGGVQVAARRVTLADRGDLTAATFNIEPDAAGTFVYQVRALAPGDDANPRDNARDAEVEVVDRQTRVLLFASGPMRDYQYLRNQLHRDKSMIVDVLLQSGAAGISQDASKILSKFPANREELYPYDCIVAFDPDWSELDPTQVAILESWVAEEAGGLILVAGPIHTAELTRNMEQSKVRDLYPVVFQRRFTLLDDGQYGGKSPWPLELESAGREAKFLWLEKSADESALAWDRFPGVFGFFDVKGEKPGATVYARFSDPEASGLSGAQPVYFASQFYGAGQVFYIGSGEMWRLRAVEPAYFEVLYTKLIRHVSQGRILRGSSRGALMVERDRYELGESVVLRARLSDAQHRPLTIDSVTAQVIRPDGDTEAVTLNADEGRPGMYLGQFKVLQEGTFQAALPLPGGGEEPLSRFLQVRVPDRERRNAERNETLLASLASQTGGVYYARPEAAAYGGDQLEPVARLIASRAEVKTITGAPDRDFAERQMQWLLAMVAGALFLEWIVRRFNRLA